MAKKFSTDEINKIMDSMKDGEERFYPGQDGLLIHKRNPVRAPGEGLQIISDKEARDFEDRRGKMKSISGPDRSKDLDNPNFKSRIKSIKKH